MPADQELLGEEGRERRDHWLSLFVHSPDEPAEVDPEPQLQAILEHYPEFWSKRIAPFYAELYATTGLEPKVVELIVTALVAFKGWETGVRAHTTLAIKSGATPDEIRGAILVTMAFGGVSAAASGLAWAEPVLAAHESGET